MLYTCCIYVVYMFYICSIYVLYMFSIYFSGIVDKIPGLEKKDDK